MKELKKHSLSSYNLSLDEDYNLVCFEGNWLEGWEGGWDGGDKSLYSPYLCLTVNNFEYLWEEFLVCNHRDGINVDSSLSDFLFVRVFDSNNYDLAISVARQIRNTVIDMLPCTMTVEDFSCIIDSAVSKYRK